MRLIYHATQAQIVIRSWAVIAAIMLVSLIGKTAVADDMTGRASVIDGDTMEIHGTRIRLKWYTRRLLRRRQRSSLRDHRNSITTNQAAIIALFHVGIGTSATCPRCPASSRTIRRQLRATPAPMAN